MTLHLRLDDRERERLGRTLAYIEAVTPEMTALDAAAAAILDDAPLATLWPLVEAALGHVRSGAEGPRVLASLGAALAPQRASPHLRGAAALAAVLDTLRHLRVPIGRFREPRVTIATLRAAVGLWLFYLCARSVSSSRSRTALRSGDEARAHGVDRE